ncbi:MAG TPA: M20/M25/M40 family metallo-hydrolase [Bacteroidales bacterium]|nr:M20/M25/M40 family metallo-hydrolase [Bacteroidales bacterium]
MKSCSIFGIRLNFRKQLMTPSAYLSVIMLFSLVTFVFYSCTKEEDPVLSTKDLMTFDLIEEINADSIRFLVTWMQDMGTRLALAENRREVARDIRNRFRMIGYDNAELDSFLITKTYNNVRYQLMQYNVIASLPGTDYPDSVTIIGGHYDNILNSGDPFATVPGANDNASGVAAALEMARVFKNYNYLPTGTIRFIAFGSEELGLFGSYDYSGKARSASENIKMMLNNDMIAYQPGTDISSWTVNIMDYENSGTLRSKAEKLCLEFTALKFVTDNKNNRYSDSYPFSLNGFKSLFFFSNIIDPNYHTLNDLAGNCNFEYCREIVKLNCAIAVHCN